MQANLAAVHTAIAAAIPDREAIVFRDRRLTWGEIADRSNRLGHVLVAQEVGHHVERSALASWEAGQDRVALMLHNGNEYLESMIACYKARSVPVNINYRYVAEELEYVLRDAGATAIIYHSAFGPVVDEIRADLPCLRLFIEVDDGTDTAGAIDGALDYESALAGSSSAALDLPWSPDDLYILYTGGTTGMPKAVLWRQADIWDAAIGVRPPAGYDGPWELDQIVAAAQVGGLRSMPTSPLMHGAAHWFSFFTWHSGGTVVLPPNTASLDPAGIWSTIEREQVNALSMVGDAFATPLLDELDAHTYDTRSLRLIASGGAALSVGMKREFQKRFPDAMILDSMGSSEGGMHGQNVTTAGQEASTGDFTLAPDTTVLDAALTRLASPLDEEDGWLARSGPIPLGYLGDRDKTERTFPVVGGKRYAVAGDRARLRPDGSIDLLGRDAVTINSGGEKIFAEEVESALRDHPSVYDVVVVGRPSERWGSECVAVVQLRPGADADVDSMLEAAGTHVARYKLPKEIIVVDRVERSPAGKPNYRWAQAVAAGGTA